jgi:hypothetical protein
MGSSSKNEPSTTSTQITDSYNATWTQSLGQNAFGILGNVGSANTLINAIDSGNITGSYNTVENISTGAGSPVSGGGVQADKGGGTSSLLGGAITQWLPWLALGFVAFILFRRSRGG